MTIKKKIKKFKTKTWPKFKKKVVRKVTALLAKTVPVKKNKIFLECFLAQSYGDNPKYIYQEMIKRGLDKQYKMVWSFRKNKMNLDVPGKHIKVRYMSVRFFYHLLTSKYIINNSRFPYFVNTNKRSVFMQTWHGTPLKRLGLDQEEVYMPNTTTARYKANMVRASSKWTYMISQNYFSTERFCSAFGITPDKIVEIGYPRDDLLSIKGEERIQKQREIKKSLGIPEGKKVLLYAPTFRDDDTKGKKYRHTFPFDLDDFANSISDDYVVVLRLHYLVSQAIGGKTNNSKVINASNYNDITELYLISDVMITDYSSVMFDFSITKNPMLFYMYDIENYRDKLRGFYFDISELPGPIVTEYEDLVKCVNSIDTIKNDYKQAYDRFVSKFTYLDDGNASARAVDALFK